ncbi:GNAT family N-acetyltransferase [Cognatilysobacter segetis]|uniref:GNAT family N-acetyltransferase n=1 Tax=Cognatilysobacter segetis TaxID=2492394 RepID=UPI00105FA792|nr:GNAT family N-acetyltransferase [Lysobacter segetis]
MTDVAHPSARSTGGSRAIETAASSRDAELHAATLSLRLLDEGDRALYHALHSSREVMRAIGPPLDADAIDARFGRVLRHNRSQRPGHRAWAVIPRDAAKPVGLTALLRDGVRAEFGIMLLPAAQRRGIAGATIAALLPHAFGDMRLMHVDASRPDGRFVHVIDAMFAPFGFRRVPGLRPGEVGWTLSRDNATWTSTRLQACDPGGGPTDGHDRRPAGEPARPPPRS